MIKFNVGNEDEKQEFSAHEYLFQDRFTKHCEPQVDFETGMVELEDVDPEIFELYIQHLYTGDIPCRQTKLSSAMSYDYQDLMLVKFFALAEALHDETAMHAALQAFLWSFRRLQKAGKRATPSMGIMRHVYELTDDESSLRRLLVDMHIWDDTYIDSVDYGLPELARDVAKAATKKWKYQTETNESKHTVCCDYLDSSNNCRTMKRKRGEDDGEPAKKTKPVKKKKRAREETPEDEVA